MSRLFGTLRDIVGLSDAVDEYEYFYEDDEEMLDETDDDDFTLESNMSSTTNNVIGMHGSGQFWSNAASEIIVLEPRSFEEMSAVMQSLRDRKSIILNLNLMDAAQAQRSVDFVAGGTFAIDGRQERLGESIFLFTPNCVQVRTQEAPPLTTEEQPPTSSSETTFWQNPAVMNNVELTA